MLLMVVRRGEREIYETLKKKFEKPGKTEVVWDRRQTERRRRVSAAPVERRRSERRGPPTESWMRMGFVLAKTGANGGDPSVIH